MASGAFAGDRVVLGSEEFVAVPAVDRSVALSEALPAFEGAAGLLRVSTTDVGLPRRLRLAAHGTYAQSEGLVVPGDRNLRLQGAVAVGYTPVRFLEVFGALYGASNRNRRDCSAGSGPTSAGSSPNNGPCVPESGRSDPETLRSMGDLVVGTKFARPLAAGFSAGTEIALRFLSSTNGGAFEPRATSVWMGGLLGYDARARRQLPLRFHASGGFYLDNSSALQDLSRASPRSRAVSAFAYGIGYDRISAAFAVDAPIPVGTGLVLQPLGEFHVDRVVTSHAAGNPALRPDCSGPGSCDTNRHQMSVTVGARARMAGGLSVDLGVDWGLRSFGSAYGSVQTPWSALLGLAYAVDLTGLGPQRVVVRTVTVEKIVVVEKDLPPREGFVTGKISTGSGGSPAEGSVVAIVDGRLGTTGLPIGKGDLEIAAPNFEPKVVQAKVTLGASTEISAMLVPKTADVRGRVQGRLLDPQGNGLAQRVTFVGPESVEVNSDASGLFAVSLAPGAYSARAGEGSFLQKEAHVQVGEGGQLVMSLALRPRPERASVTLKPRALALARPLAFRGARSDGARGTAPGLASGVAPGLAGELAAESLPLLDEVADIMLRRPDLGRLQVVAHWDRTGSEDVEALTDAQARIVADYLVTQGVPAARIEAVGMGASQPVVPNIGRLARLRNRRVEFRLANN